MIERIKHIGIAVNSIDETMALWKEVFNAVEEKRAVFEIVGQTSALVRIGDTYIELMEPLEGVEKSTVRKFIETHGEGIHHLSLKTTDLEKDTEMLKQKGIKIIGAGQPVVFTYPKTSNGIVYEITEMED